MSAREGGWVPGRVSGCPGGRVGAWEGGCWVHKGVSEGVTKWVAWFGGLGLCSLVRGTSIGFSPCIFLCAFFSMGFSPWVLGGGPRTW